MLKGENRVKYYTKEWYKASQQTNMDLRLKECKEAGVFSEVYFEKLYHAQLKEFLDSWKEVSSEEFEEMLFIQKFEEAFRYNKKYLEQNLPQYILEQVADIRVLTLQNATKEIIGEICKFCDKNRKIVEQARQDYIDYIDKVKEALDIEMISNIHFHDCIITEFKRDQEEICLTFDNGGGFTTLTEAKFTGAVIEELDMPLEQCWWIYDEIYKVQNEYELHVLIQSQSMKLGYFTFRFKNAYFK